MDKYSEIHTKNIEKVLNYIRNNLNDDLNLTKLAEIGCYSPYHFHRIFKSLCGETVYNHIKRLRLEKSLFLIKTNPGVLLTDIAAMSGFSTHSSFSRDFKKLFNVTPKFIQKNDYVPVLKKKITSAENQFDDNDVQIMEFPEREVVYLHSTGGYSFNLGLLWMKIHFQVARYNFFKDKINRVGIIYDDPDITPKKNLRYDACIEIPENCEIPSSIISIKKIPKMTCAVLNYKNDISEIGSYLDSFYGNWLIKSKWYPGDFPPYQLYSSGFKSINNFNLCIPIKKTFF